MDRSDSKITLCKTKFNMAAHKKLTEEEINSVSETARIFFYFINAFRLKYRLRSFVNVWMVEDRIQDLDSVTGEIFQIHFYENLFNPDANSSIQGESRLRKTTVEKLLNELFFLNNINENEIKMEAYADEIDITIKK